jgi:TetR/AcrR family transcriptional regulator, cholesterol catabolism regulator
MSAPSADPPAQRDTTKARLYDAAAELFRTKGFAATTTREIAAALGIQKATLYHHIRRKEDLLYEMCRDSLTRIQSAADQVLAESSDSRGRLVNLIHAHMVTSLGDRDKHAVMLAELRSLPLDESVEIFALRHEYELCIERTITDAQVAGVVRTDITAKDLRLSLLNLLNWTIFWFDPAGGRTPSELGELYAGLFLEGAAARPTAAADLGTSA